MPHHGQEIPPHWRNQFNIDAEQVNVTLEEIQSKLGATGKFPEGKLNEHDEGELKFGIALDPNNKTIVLAFGKAVSWIAFDVNSARQLISLMEEKLREVKRMISLEK